jgi:hypothetical protein
MSTQRPSGLDLVDPVLGARLDSGLAATEIALRESVRSDYPFITEASRHLVDAGGKRFRPLLVLLALGYGFALTRFHDSPITVLKTLCAFNVLLLAASAWFTWRDSITPTQSSQAACS